MGCRLMFIMDRQPHTWQVGDCREERMINNCRLPLSDLFAYTR